MVLIKIKIVENILQEKEEQEKNSPLFLALQLSAKVIFSI
jgi:hypothetical protein